MPGTPCLSFYLCLCGFLELFVSAPCRFYLSLHTFLELFGPRTHTYEYQDEATQATAHFLYRDSFFIVCDTTKRKKLTNTESMTEVCKSKILMKVYGCQFFFMPQAIIFYLVVL